MNLKTKVKNLLHYLYYQFLVLTNVRIKNQRKNPLSIPIIIINYNQLYYLKQLINFLEIRGFNNIVIIDNQSTYPPLLEYYNEKKEKLKVEYMNENYGHRVFYKNTWLQQKYAKGYYVLTDADIVPNDNLPTDFMKMMINYLDKYFNSTSKIGFALRIDDLPETFPLKNKVTKWEKQFWKQEKEKDLYEADLDTTFALYKPNYPSVFYNINFYRGLRIAGNFTATHGGWYKDPNNMTDEDKFYQQTANKSSSWNFDAEGNHVTSEYDKFV